MRKLLALLAAPLLLLAACNNEADVKSSTSGDSIASQLVDGHPAWILQGNIYEVNIRQYTPEGTFNAFATHLPRLKEMGVQTLWFMPIQPISKKDRKGPMGSYYAIADYTAINPEFGTMDDWKNLVKQAHDMGFKVIIDWVANHTGADHAWLTRHPDFYEKDPKTGQPIAPFDWTDVRKLNYRSPAVGDSMIAAMQFWVNESNIDGFRCDVAAEVPKEFWSRAITDLRKKKNLFMLAEADKPWLHEAGFDASYGWPQFHKMKEIAKGQRPASSLDSLIQMVDTSFPKNAIIMYFTSNHDENSWNQADFGTMPGATHAPFAVLTQTIGRTVPLIYSGQEEPFSTASAFSTKTPSHLENTNVPTSIRPC